MTFSNISRLAASNGHKPSGGCSSCGRDLSPEVSPKDQGPDAVCAVCYIASTCPGGHTVQELQHLDAATVHTVFACTNLLAHFAEMHVMSENLLDLAADPPEAQARHDFAMKHVRPCRRQLAKAQRHADIASKQVMLTLVDTYRKHEGEVDFVLAHHEMGQSIATILGAATRRRRR